MCIMVQVIRQEHQVVSDELPADMTGVIQDTWVDGYLGWLYPQWAEWTSSWYLQR